MDRTHGNLLSSKALMADEWCNAWHLSVVFHIELLDILEHPNPNRYPGQRIFVVRREDYVYLAPFVPR